MNNVYSCPPELIWSPTEMQNEKKRHCSQCNKVCNDVFARTIRPKKETLNFCSKQCWDAKILHKEMKKLEQYLGTQ